MNCIEISPNLEAFALGTLDRYHAARVEKHLQSCAACRHTLASFREAVGELPHALSKASPLRPPSSLKEKVMRAAEADLRAREQVRTMQETFTVSPGQFLVRRKRSAWVMHPWLSFIALGVSTFIIAALVLWAVSANARLQQALDSELGVREQLVEQGHQVLNTLEDPDAVYLLATDPDSKAYGKLLFDTNKRDVVFLAYNLPQPQLSRRYILWTRNKGYMQRVAQFTPDVEGMAMASFKVDSNLVLKEVYVTEQLPTYPLPSEPKILRWISDKTSDY
jgi:hypothetical protein